MTRTITAVKLASNLVRAFSRQTKSLDPLGGTAAGTRLFAISAALSLIFAVGCQSGSSRVNDFNPTVDSISPTTALAGSAPFTLTVYGDNFQSSSVVSFGGMALQTSFTNETTLTAMVPAAAVVSPATAQVLVIDQPGSGGKSNTVSFAISSGANPSPNIAGLFPQCAPVGTQAVDLFLTGTNFVSGSVVRWNGNNQPTTVISGQELETQLAAEDLRVAGDATIAVSNPAPGGGGSNTSIFSVVTGAAGPQSITVDPTGKFAYVADQNCGKYGFGSVSMYTIDPTSGALTSVGPPVTSNDEGSQFVTTDPSGRFLYVANWGSGDTVGSVSSFTIDPSGFLRFTGAADAPCEPPPIPGSCAPWGIAVDPSGKFVYVANEGGPAPTSTSIYTLDPTNGTLAFVALTFGSGRVTSITVHPSGKFAYITNVDNGFPGESNSVSMYSIQNEGLVLLGTVTAGSLPGSIAIHPSGKFAYVTNKGSNDVSMFTIDTATGLLASLGQVAVGSKPVAVAVDPSGKFAYVADSGSNEVSMFTIDQATGVLTSAGKVAAGTSPSSIAIRPSGKFAYVANFGSNSISAYSIDPTTGALTLIGTVGS
jgi:YVTN family beta-propeller protein